jgi:hypothetical protein
MSVVHDGRPFIAVVSSSRPLTRLLRKSAAETRAPSQMLTWLTMHRHPWEMTCHSHAATFSIDVHSCTDERRYGGRKHRFLIKGGNNESEMACAYGCAFRFN